MTSIPTPLVARFIRDYSAVCTRCRTSAMREGIDFEIGGAKSKQEFDADVRQDAMCTVRRDR
jgi:hypothetical protein